jgi:hypothetical protein
LPIDRRWGLVVPFGWFAQATQAVKAQSPLQQRHCERQRSNPWCGKIEAGLLRRISAKLLGNFVASSSQRRPGEGRDPYAAASHLA